MLLGEHFVWLLKGGQAKSQLALSREYGVSGGWMRSICETVKLAPEILEQIAAMNEAEANDFIRFRELYNISQIKDHAEQVRLFAEMTNELRLFASATRRKKP